MGCAWSPWTPFIVSIVCSLVFIARTAFTVNGEVYFSLFDDAMISMRYARNLAEGHGLAWNVGQTPVEGYTNFLWTLWMALLHLLPIPESKISLIVALSGASILTAHLLVVRHIAVRLAPQAPLVALLALWLTALFYPLIYWTLRGMEVGLITLTLSMSVLLALRLRDRVRHRDLIMLAGLMALGALTRPDFILPSVVISAFALSTARPASRSAITMVLVGSVVGTLVIHATFRMLYYGVPLPNTYYLKVSGAALSARLSRGLQGLLVLDLLHMVVPVTLSSAYVVARARSGSCRSGVYLLAALFVVLCAYSVYVGGDAWEDFQYANRYVTPGMPGILVLSAMAIDDLLRQQTRSRRMAIQALACLFLLVSLISATVPVAVGEVLLSPLDARLRLVRAAITFTPVLVLPLLFVPSSSGNRQIQRLLTSSQRQATVAVALTVASLVAINGQAVSVWLRPNAAAVTDDEWTTTYGLALRNATSDDATIAVTWAGAIPYFSHRPTVDLLGKSDPVVARQTPHTSVGFTPGHDKWDYGYSIGQLRPDVVAQLWQADEFDLRAIERWGYIRVMPWVFVRADSTKLDRLAVRDAACAVLAGDPTVLATAQKQVVDFDEIRARYCR